MAISDQWAAFLRKGPGAELIGAILGARDAAAITPSDSVDIVDGSGNAKVCQGIWVGTAGNITCTMASGNDVLISNIAAGSNLSIWASRVKSTGTTASNLVAWFN